MLLPKTVFNLKGYTTVVKIVITLRSNSAFSLIVHCPKTGMQNGGEDLPSIISAGRGPLVNDYAHNS